MSPGKAVTIYLPNLKGGGAERLQINLARAFQETGLSVEFVLNRLEGELLSSVPSGVGVFGLGSSRQLAAILALSRYIRAKRPDIILSSLGHNNIIAIWANIIAGSPSRVIVSQHNNLSNEVKTRGIKYKLLPFLYRHFLPFAAGVVTVSKGVADDMAVITGHPRSSIDVIYNGVVTPQFQERSREKIDHPWFNQGFPVVIAAGRMVAQKDYPNLLEAFAEVSRHSSARLIILGDGPLRDDLISQRGALGLDDIVDMPGFVENPLPFILAANVLVSSSRFEGFGIIHAEALACGTAVVCTDCPSGPAEILDYGRYGRLVPVGDKDALAAALLQTLESPPDRETLQRRGLAFSVEKCAAQYLEMFQRALAA